MDEAFLLADKRIPAVMGRLSTAEPVLLPWQAATAAATADTDALPTLELANSADAVALILIVPSPT